VLDHISCDRAAIMVRGRLRAIGSSIRLKHKLGSGYQVCAQMLHPGDSVLFYTYQPLVVWCSTRAHILI
jgi:ABC-type multidrug transport system ATPase subunit